MDLGLITNIVGLATTAVGATGQAASTAETIKKLFASEKKVDNGEAQALLNTLATQLTTANIMNVELSDAIRVLTGELRRQDEFEQEKARYELFQTGQNDIVLKLKEDAANGQPVHFICPVCLNRDKLVSFITGDGDYKRCQTDNKHIYKFNDLPRQSFADYGRSLA